eukprot:12904323-Prorocentrum_lima.AAC.1
MPRLLHVVVRWFVCKELMLRQPLHFSHLTGTGNGTGVVDTGSVALGPGRRPSAPPCFQCQERL